MQLRHHRTELTINLIYALVTTQIQQRELLDDAIFFGGRNGLKIVDFLLLVPQ